MGSTEPRQRIVVGAADMLRRRGVNATSVRELAEHANAQLGSTYHYFPGGKQQLVTEAVRFAGDVVTTSDFTAGCPVLAVSVEEPADGATALAAAAEVFTRWESLLADSLRRHGTGEQDADQVATLIVAAVEGAVAMCRAKRSAEPP